MAGAGAESNRIPAETIELVLSKIESKEWEVKRRVNNRRKIISAAWDIFGDVVAKDSGEHQGYVKCFKCQTIRRWVHSPNKKSPPTTALKSHRCSSTSINANQQKSTPSLSDRLVFKDACVNVMAGDLRPSTTFSSDEFQQLIQTTCDIQAKHGSEPLNAALLISDRTTLVRHMEAVANKGRTSVTTDLLAATEQGVGKGASTDMWTDQFKQRHYMSLTMHLIDHTHRLLNLILSVSQFNGDSESAELLASHLENELKRFQVDPASVVFVTDGAANIIKALDILNIKRLYCMNHCLNIVLRSSFNMKLVDIDLFGEAGKTTYEWVSLASLYIKTTRRRKSDAMKQVKRPPPQSESSRRYNSKVPCMESVHRHFDEVCQFLHDGGQQEILGNLDKDKISDTIEFLKPIEERAKPHNNDLAEINIEWLNNHIADAPGDSPYLRHLKDNARIQLAGRHAIELMQKCKQIVTLFKRWGVNDILDESLKQEIPTRWNSLLIMLMSFPSNFEQVNAILTQKNRLEFILSEEEQEDIKALIKFLKPWKEQSDKVEADLYPTLQYVLIAACCLEDVCKPNATDSVKIRHLRARAGQLLREKFIPDSLHKIAAFLWPDFRSLKMLKSRSERKEVYDMVHEMIVKQSGSNVNEPSRKRRKGGDGYDKWRSLSDEEENDEVEEYLSAKFDLCPGEKLHVWWKQQAHRFPKLAKLAREVLSIPASSASSERAFSIAGLLFSSRRTSLGADHLDDMIFVRSHLRYLKQTHLPLPEIQDQQNSNSGGEEGGEQGEEEDIDAALPE